MGKKTALDARPNAPFPTDGTNMSTRCPNPDCPRLLTLQGNYFTTERGLGTHLQKSEKCDQWVDEHPGWEADRPPFPIPELPTAFGTTSPEPLQRQETPSDGGSGGGQGEEGPPSPQFRIERIAGAAQRDPERVGTEYDRRKATEKRPGNPFFPFCSAEAYDFVQWAVRTKQTLTAIDDLLKTRYVSTHSVIQWWPQSHSPSRSRIISILWALRQHRRCEISSSPPTFHHLLRGNQRRSSSAKFQTNLKLFTIATPTS